MAFRKVEKFEKINRSKLILKDSFKRTRTGAFKTKSYVKAHGKMHKH